MKVITARVQVSIEKMNGHKYYSPWRLKYERGFNLTDVNKFRLEF